MNTIADKWKKYLELVVPVGASDVQRIETCRAFYAGATTMFGLMMEATDHSEDAAQALLSSFEDEIHLFREKVSKGEA